MLRSVLALIIAGLAYFDQRDVTAETINSYKASLAANRMQYAALVTYYSNGPQSYVVQNLSQRSMPEVVLEMDVTVIDKSIYIPIGATELGIAILDLPACSAVTLNFADPDILYSAMAYLYAQASPTTPVPSNYFWPVSPDYLSLIDPNGLYWIETQGALIKQTTSLENKNEIYLVTGTPRSISGCG